MNEDIKEPIVPSAAQPPVDQPNEQVEEPEPKYVLGDKVQVLKYKNIVHYPDPKRLIWLSLEDASIKDIAKFYSSITSYYCSIDDDIQNEIIRFNVKSRLQVDVVTAVRMMIEAMELQGYTILERGTMEKYEADCVMEMSDKTNKLYPKENSRVLVFTGQLNTSKIVKAYVDGIKTLRCNQCKKDLMRLVKCDPMYEGQIFRTCMSAQRVSNPNSRPNHTMGKESYIKDNISAVSLTYACVNHGCNKHEKIEKYVSEPEKYIEQIRSLLDRFTDTRPKYKK